MFGPAGEAARVHYGVMYCYEWTTTACRRAMAVGGAWKSDGPKMGVRKATGRGGALFHVALFPKSPSSLQNLFSIIPATPVYTTRVARLQNLRTAQRELCWRMQLL